jgi:hypothetical protein
MPDDFEAFAKTALGTDDPERLRAFKEAIKICYENEEEAPASEETDEGEGGDMAGAMSKGKGSMLGKLFG